MGVKLLLTRSVDKLGIVGDVVTVAEGYARNYLLPHGLATQPTQGNMRRLAEARRQAERELAEQKARLEELLKRLEGVELTIQAKANEEGHLYGSVGKREVSHALEAEGYFVKPDQIVLDHPIRHLDNTNIDIRLGPELRTTIKLWVVREKTPGEEGAESSNKVEAGKEAGGHGEGGGS